VDDEKKNKKDGWKERNMDSLGSEKAILGTKRRMKLIMHIIKMKWYMWVINGICGVEVGGEIILVAGVGTNTTKMICILQLMNLRNGKEKYLKIKKEVGMKEIKEKWEEILKMMDEIKKYEAIVEEMIYMMTIKMWIIVRKIDEIEKEEIKINEKYKI